MLHHGKANVTQFVVDKDFTNLKTIEKTVFMEVSQHVTCTLLWKCVLF